MSRATRVAAGIVLAAGATVLLAGCVSDADRVSENLSTAAEQFEVERQIVFYNGITDTYVAEVIGRCSVESGGGQLEVTCKVGPDEFTKDYLGLSDNVTWFAHQTKTVDADEYNYRVVLKPETIIPDLDLQTEND